MELIDKTKISDGKKKWKNPVNHAIIGELLRESSEKKGWTDSKGGFLQCLNGDDINKNIARDTKTFSAANKFLNLFYEGAEKFAKGNYTIN